MKFTKSFLTYEQQADRLIRLGLTGDLSKIIERLQSVSYYRLSGYWYPDRKPDPASPKQKLSEFFPDASIDEVWDRYVFDRRLRLLVMDAIERIEVDARNRLAYLHASKHGPFGYADDPQTLPKLLIPDRHHPSKLERTILIENLRQQAKSSHEDFVKHFQAKYGKDHIDLPIWVACELMSFGNLFTFYRGCESSIQKDFSAQYKIQDAVCLSWLRSLNTIRNICAHHSRLWNRVLDTKPSMPHKDPLWRERIPNDRVFAVLTICRYLLSIISPGNEWTNRFKELLADYPDIPRAGLGLIPDWDQHPLWML